MKNNKIVFVAGLSLFLISLLLNGGVARAYTFTVQQWRYIYGTESNSADYGAGSEVIKNSGSLDLSCSSSAGTSIVPCSTSYGSGAKPILNAVPTINWNTLGGYYDKQWWFYWWTAPAGNADPCNHNKTSYSPGSNASDPCQILNSGSGITSDLTLEAHYHSYHNAVSLSGFDSDGRNLCTIGGGPTIRSDKNFHKTGDSGNYTSTTLCNVNDSGGNTVAQTEPAAMYRYTYTADATYTDNSSINYRFLKWQTAGPSSLKQCSNTNSFNGTSLDCPATTYSVCADGTTSNACLISTSFQPEATAIMARAIYIARFNLGVATDGNGFGTVSSSPAGISNCGGLVSPDCNEVYDKGTNITLTATPTLGSQFVKWSGDSCDGSTSLTCVVTMDRAKNVTATFSLIQVVLTVQTTNNGSGSVTGSGGINCSWNGTVQSGTCTVSFDPGTAISFTETPSSPGNGGYWRSCPSAPAASTCAFTINATTIIIADFKKDSIPSITLSNVRCNARKIRVDVADADGGASAVDYSLLSDFSIRASVSSGSDADLNALTNFSSSSPYSVQTVYFRTLGTAPGSPWIGGTVNGTYANNSIKYARSTSPDKPCSYYKFDLNPTGTTDIYNYILAGKTYPYAAKFDSGYTLSWTGATGPSGVRSCVTRGYYVQYASSGTLKYFANRTAVSLAPVPDQDSALCTTSPVITPITSSKTYSDGGSATHNLDQVLDGFNLRSGDKVCVYVHVKYGNGFVDANGNIAPADTGPNDSDPIVNSEKDNTDANKCQTVPWAYQIIPSASFTPVDEESWKDINYTLGLVTTYNCSRTPTGCAALPTVSAGDNGGLNEIKLPALTATATIFFNGGAGTTKYPCYVPDSGPSAGWLNSYTSNGTCNVDSKYAPSAGDEVCINYEVKDSSGRGLADETGKIIRKDANTSTAPNDFCIKRSNHPYFKVFNAGASAGSCFVNSTGSCIQQPKQIKAYAKIGELNTGSVSYAQRSFKSNDNCLDVCDSKACIDSNFPSDPAPGLTKYCFWKPGPALYPPLTNSGVASIPSIPAGYAFCADEYETSYAQFSNTLTPEYPPCQFDGTADILYGRSGRYYDLADYDTLSNTFKPKPATGTVPCNDATFYVDQTGNPSPLPGMRKGWSGSEPKACFFRPRNADGTPNPIPALPWYATGYTYCATEGGTCHFPRIASKAAPTSGRPDDHAEIVRYGIYEIGCPAYYNTSYKSYFYSGASVQYAAQVFDKIDYTNTKGIKGFYTNSQNAICSMYDKGVGYLTLANNKFNPNTIDIGGNFNGARVMPDYFSLTRDSGISGDLPPYVPAVGYDLSTESVSISDPITGLNKTTPGFDDGKQYILNQNTVFQSNTGFMDIGERSFTVYVNGDVVINSDIYSKAQNVKTNNPASTLFVAPTYTFDNEKNLPHAPILTIIACGNIYISSSVKNITGVFIAQSSSSEPGSCNKTNNDPNATVATKNRNGQIFTCARYTSASDYGVVPFSDPNANKALFRSCGGEDASSRPKNKLNIYGALIADRVNMYRVSQSLRFAPVHNIKCKKNQITYPCTDSIEGPNSDPGPSECDPNWEDFVNKETPGIKTSKDPSVSISCAAEEVWMLPEFLISPPVLKSSSGSTKNGISKFDSYRTAPPTF